MSVRGDLVARVLLSCVAAYVALLICGLYFGVGGVAHHHVEAGWYWLLAGLVLYTYSRSNGRHHRANVDGLALRRWTGVGMLGVSGVVYAPSLFIGFLSDDFVLVDRAVHGAFWDFPSPELFRPTPLLLWRGIFEVVGQSPLALHLVNVVIHGLNASLVVAVASRLTNDGVLAFCAGLIFLTLPSNVEAVAWASGVQDVLMTFGCLIFVLCAMGRPSLWVGALAVVALVVGLLAKEAAVVAPVLGLLVVDRIRTPRRMVLIGTGAAVCLVYGLWRLTAVTLPSEYAVVPSQYFLKEFLVRPWGTLTVPWSGAMLEAHPSVGVTSGVFVVALLSWATLGRRGVGSGWALSRLALWVTVSVVPVYAYLFIADNMQGSRYLYLAAVGWSLLLVELVRMSFDQQEKRGRTAALAILSVLIVAGAVGSRKHLRPWEEAALLRDKVISSAMQRLQSTGCQSAVFEEVPDSLEGAYVFRNGFGEALKLVTGRRDVLGDSPDGHCKFRWSGEQFLSEEPQPDPAD